MGPFLRSKGHAKAEELRYYNVKVVPFEWESGSNVDCGVFLMHYFENFKGLTYTDPNLGQV